MHITRRDFAKLVGAAGAGAAATTGVSRFAIAQSAPKVVIVGGGAGGATAAHLLKKEEPKLEVTLIETNPIYSSSFFSNLYLGGFREIESLNHGYQGSDLFWMQLEQLAAKAGFVPVGKVAH